MEGFRYQDQQVKAYEKFALKVADIASDPDKTMSDIGEALGYLRYDLVAAGWEPPK